MAKTVKPDKLAAEIHSILAEYGADIDNEMEGAVKRVAKAGVAALRRAAKRLFGGSGKYAKGWASTVETRGHSTQGIIYNKDLPGLPHLLEHGHLNRDGSRTPGKLHIAPVEEEIARTFAEEVEKSI